MIARAILLLTLVSPAGAFAQSAQVCPWLSAGTAAKILGAEVSATAHSDSNWSGACRFAVVADPARTIEIEVGAKEIDRCGSNSTSTPLAAIGNQATLCSYRDGNGRQVEIVTGRVRNAWFAVTLAAKPEYKSNPQWSNAPPSSSAIEFLGEQVAGNLY
jgi:hypothetical protein